VKVGASDGEYTEILGGLADGAQVIYKGYEGLKDDDPVAPSRWGADGPLELPNAQSEPTPGDSHAGHTAGAPLEAPAAGGVQTVTILVKGAGFEPSQVTLKAGVPAKLIFKRVEESCASEIVFPDLKIKKALPLNQPVAVEFTPKKGGALSFACGMNMLKGTVIVQ